MKSSYTSEQNEDVQCGISDLFSGLGEVILSNPSDHVGPAIFKLPIISGRDIKSAYRVKIYGETNDKFIRTARTRYARENISSGDCPHYGYWQIPYYESISLTPYEDDFALPATR